MIIGDLVSLRGVRYLLVVSDDILELLRVEGRVRASVIGSAAIQGTSPEDWKAALTAITNSSAYWGQPIEVLLNTKRSFAYIRRLDSVNSGQIRELVEPLQTEDVLLHYQVKRLGKTQYLLAGGTDRQLYDGLYQALAKSFPLLLGVKLLALYLAEKSLTQTMADKSIIRFFDIGSSKVSLVSDPNGHVIYTLHCNVHGEDAAGGFVNWVKDSFPGTGESVDVVSYTAKSKLIRHSEGQATNVASILGTRPGEPPAWKAAAGLAPVRPSAKVGSIALNSLRLLLHVLGSLLMLALAVLAITSVISSGKREVTDEYQRLYSEQIQVNRSIDSVRAAISYVQNAAGPHLPAADLVAAFCQIRYDDVYLTRLDIAPGEAAPIVEASGIARTEQAAFRYGRKLNEFLSPFEVRMNSVSPQIDRSQRPPDTVVTFRMSMVAANDNQ